MKHPERLVRVLLMTAMTIIAVTLIARRSLCEVHIALVRWMLPRSWIANR